MAGIGHKNYNDFQWWDHAFNKAAQAFDIKVTDNQGPVVVKSKNLGNISTKKRHTNVESNQLEYGVFHKTGTLHNGVVEATASTITLKEEADYSLKLSDEDLFKLCNGLTAHKYLTNTLFLLFFLVHMYLMFDFSVSEELDMD